MSIRVVLADDNVLVREGVRALLEASDGVDVVGVASDAPSLMETAGALGPDVVVTDIKMPPNFRLEGIDCAHEIRARHPDTGVVVLSAHDDEEYALALLGQGRSGLAYLLKDRLAEGDELVRAIHEVAAGGSAVDPGIAARLSGREEAGEEDRRILDMMAAGMGYAEMAEALGTTQEALDHRVTALFGRLASDAGGGTSHAVDELKKLHAAVVDAESSARTLRQFVPAQLAERLAREGSVADLQEELEVTILFSDIRGYSTLAEKLSPREVADAMARHFAAMAEVVAAHQGSIDQFAGDAIMAVFSTTESQADHAGRAIRCALAMQARQQALNTEADRMGLPPLGMGIGVNTGQVVAGTLGGSGRLEYTVLGDAVNVAARLQTEAAAGEVLATASTVAAVPSLDAEPVGARQVKGRTEPIDVFRVFVGAG
ncbi:MAG TPA: adenylate/guanylate cyclase domain-containing protein [Actinomycetota bacterium]|nr:adenylate/guanylate cyclase domain-containing protein [Actinomycetota bacterium]